MSEKTICEIAWPIVLGIVCWGIGHFISPALAVIICIGGVVSAIIYFIKTYGGSDY